MIASSLHKDIILKRSLPFTIKNNKASFTAEFREYYTWCKKVVHHEADENSPPASSPDNPYLHPPSITFSELVDKMRTSYNGHWTPVSEWCELCTNKLDYVAKLEGEPWELWYLVDRLGLWKDRNEFLSRKNSATGKVSTESELKMFTSQLSGNQRKFLNVFFKHDNMMFGYGSI